MLILGIETSCDESGVAVYDTDAGLLAHTLYSQVALHAEYGGVVPELASRDHVRKLLPLVDQALLAAGRKLSEIQGIAYTGGPGLIGALLVGAAVARAMAWRLHVPALAVNHMEGHLLAAMLDDPSPKYPFVCLLVSGGHTQLFDVKAPGMYELLGESLDDAVGEAFDKTAKMLGLGYPGGPALAKLAEQGNIERYQFPRPMTDRPGLDFSFSGLKTHAITAWRAAEQNQQTRADIAIAFQSAAVETLLIKSRRALAQTGYPRLVVAGGVGANQHLRLRFTETFTDAHQQVYYPRLEFCTDNGAMIAYAGALRLLAGEADSGKLWAKPRWRLDEVMPIGG